MNRRGFVGRILAGALAAVGMSTPPAASQPPSHRRFIRMEMDEVGRWICTTMDVMPREGPAPSYPPLPPLYRRVLIENRPISDKWTLRTCRDEEICPFAVEGRPIRDARDIRLRIEGWLPPNSS